MRKQRKKHHTDKQQLLQMSAAALFWRFFFPFFFKAAKMASPESTWHNVKTLSSDLCQSQLSLLGTLWEKSKWRNSQSIHDFKGFSKTSSITLKESMLSDEFRFESFRAALKEWLSLEARKEMYYSRHFRSRKMLVCCLCRSIGSELDFLGLSVGLVKSAGEKDKQCYFFKTYSWLQHQEEPKHFIKSQLESTQPGIQTFICVSLLLQSRNSCWNWMQNEWSVSTTVFYQKFSSD